MADSSTQLRIGVRSAPLLADHGFHGMVVLPGSFYLEAARRLDRDRSGGPGAVRDVSFHRPIILSADDTVITVEVQDDGAGAVRYTFYEVEADENGAAPKSARREAATLTIERQAAGAAPSPSSAHPAALSIEGFQRRARTVIDAERFYRKLRQNGNHYGPGFQRVETVWRAGDETLGKLSVAGRWEETGARGFDPSLLDGVMQLLASFTMDEGRTVVLRSIERVEIRDGDLPDVLWGHADLRREDAPEGSGLFGSVRVFDPSGEECVRLSGVSFTLLDRLDEEAPESGPGLHLVVAASFTADPIDESVGFWADQFGAPVRLEFAPYGQVFQQLLDPGSALRRNRDGVGAVLLRLEEWAARDEATGRGVPLRGAPGRLAGLPTCVLPNGLEIAHLNRYETEYLYKEIFEDRTYLKHGIELPDGATVVDIGANIGMFSLFVMSRSRNPRIHAFEPAPAVHELLEANLAAYGSDAHAWNVGVADRSGSASFTFYERSSVFSGFHPDEDEDGAAVRAVVRNALRSGTDADGAAVEGWVAELTAERLRAETLECRLTSVSDVIREHRIERIDLLKIDAEKSELAILAGIDEGDWPKVRQIVLEIHDATGEAVGRVRELLVAKGFRCVVERERLLEGSGLHNLYATRSGAAAGSGAGRGAGHRVSLERNVDDFLAALRELRTHGSAPLILCVCPPSPAAEAGGELGPALAAAEERLLAAAAALPNVHTVSSRSLLERYPTPDYHDPHAHRLGHMPYSPEGYAAIGTALFRAVSRLERTPYKVIVLDCDDTLWAGACGEEGPRRVTVSEPYRRLQERMVEQVNAGKLLCLCSRNREQDVLDVFDRHPGMVLRREHLASWRIDWNRKSDNVRALAHELGLGLDSFIFIDDNPIECADVRIHCPGALVLRLPGDPESIPAFLDHVWAFDQGPATEEDRRRTRLYRENAERQEFRARTASLRDFIDGLGLRVEMVEATPDQLARVSQLTWRTNQFNFTGVRRSEEEIAAFLAREVATCLVVRVADRFGDYGTVGVAAWETLVDRYRVDTLLLSCRVLGRGVEHRVLAELGRRALSEGRHQVELVYRRTDRNAPVRAFLEAIGAPPPDGAETASLRLDADRLANLAYDPEAAGEPGRAERAGARRVPEAPRAPTRHEPPQAAGARSAAPVGTRRFGDEDPAEVLRRIAEELHDPGRLVRAIEAHRLREGRGRAGEAPDGSPGGTLEAQLLRIWRRVLGSSRVGVQDNFFDAGGTSIKAVQVIARIKRELDRDLSVVSIFECPTVSLLAARIRGERPGAGDDAPTAEALLALERGRRRRRRSRQEAR